VDPKDVLLIYGDSDKSTPVECVVEMISKYNLNCLFVKGGGHNIGGTHPVSIVSAVVDCQIKPDELASLIGLPDNRALMYFGVCASCSGVGSVLSTVISLK